MTKEEVLSLLLAAGEPVSGEHICRQLGVTRAAVWKAIDQLPEREKMTILLRFFKGLTQEQTSRILGVSQVQISRLERRGLANLRRLLDG